MEKIKKLAPILLGIFVGLLLIPLTPLGDIKLLGRIFIVLGVFILYCIVRLIKKHNIITLIIFIIHLVVRLLTLCYC